MDRSSVVQFLLISTHTYLIEATVFLMFWEISKGIKGITEVFIYSTCIQILYEMDICSGFCKCGNTIEECEGRNSDAVLSPDTEWKSNDECTSEAPTNAFGELRFADTSKQTAKYVRVGFPTNGAEEQKQAVVQQLRELLLEVWKLKQPNLIISVTGGAESFQMSNTQQKRFKRGIVRTAIKTGKLSGCATLFE